MDPDDAVDWTIRNQRVRGPVGWAWILGWAAVWFAGAMIADRLAPMVWRPVANIVLVLLILASFVVLIVHVELHPRILRLKLGDQLIAFPRRRLEPKDVQAIRLSPDPDEDYAEFLTPVPLCQLTVNPYRGSPVRLVITAGDAARIRRWAERRGISVFDPEGYSMRATR